MYSPGKNTGVGSHFLLQGSSRPKDQTQVCCTAGGFFFFFFLLSEQPGSPLFEHEREKCNQWRMGECNDKAGGRPDRGGQGSATAEQGDFRSSGFLGLMENVESPCSGNT